MNKELANLMCEKLESKGFTVIRWKMHGTAQRCITVHNSPKQKVHVYTNNMNGTEIKGLNDYRRFLRINDLHHSGNMTIKG